MKAQDIKDKLLEIDNQKRELQKQLEEAERDDTVKRLMPFRGAAILAHGLFCMYNHTDGCSWGYEQDGSEHNWGFGAEYSQHKHWLELVFKTATELNMTEAQLTDILDGLHAVKARNPRAMEALRHLLGYRR